MQQTWNRPGPARFARRAWPLALAAGVAALLGTVGYLMVGFGVLTGCTNDFSCTETLCAPCRAANSWLGAGAIGQAVLLLGVVVLAVAALARPALRRRLRPAAWVVIALSVAWIITTTVAAQSTW